MNLSKFKRPEQGQGTYPQELRFNIELPDDRTSTAQRSWRPTIYFNELPDNIINMEKFNVFQKMHIFRSILNIEEVTNYLVL